MLSRFFPKGYDPYRPVALIAGRGQYPIFLAERFLLNSIPLRLIAFHGETEQHLVQSFADSEKVIIRVGQIGRMLKALKAFDVGYALMAGQITPKRLFRGLYPDLKAIRLLAHLNEKNAETLFGAIVSEIEQLGITQLDARVLMDSELAHEGLMSGKRLREDMRYIEHGVRIAKEIARLDIGQSVVVREGVVLAVEAFEGTDAMIRCVSRSGAEHSIFIKTVKPFQNYRFDVPVFGMQTLKLLYEAKIRLAVLEAGSTLILEKEKVLREAERLRIQIYGYTSRKVID